jgi:hypothetical protein
MSFNYLPLQASATALLTKFGKQYTFTRTTKGAYNPATGQTSNTTSTYTKYACVFDYRDADAGGLTIEAGDRRLLAEGYAYEVGDTVAIGTDTYRIVSVSISSPSGTALSANLQVRK